MTSLQERLFDMQDKQYAAFQAKLTPGVPMESFIQTSLKELLSNSCTSCEGVTLTERT